MGKAKWREFTTEEIESYVKESYSFATLASKLGYCIEGGSYLTIMKSMVDELGLDTSHFTGQVWNKGKFDYSRFRYGKAIKTNSALSALTALRSYRCEQCGLSEWMGMPITLEIHHKDGDSLNNQLDNLQLLCPNCHSTTDNWKGRGSKKGRTEIVDEEKFKEALLESDNIRQALISLNLTPKGGNYIRAKEIMQKYDISFANQE